MKRNVSEPSQPKAGENQEIIVKNQKQTFKREQFGHN